jgi:serine protease Do
MMQIGKAVRLSVWVSIALSGTAFLMPAVASDGIAGALERRVRHRIPAKSYRPSDLRSYAQTITVKVLTGAQWSSGILMQRRGTTYTVLTNQHVLRTGKFYRIQTFDGRTYSAMVGSDARFARHDLATLRFRSEQNYAIATPGASLSLPMGTPVFAAGFPISESPEQRPVFQFTSGQVSLIAPKVLEGGYQIGYTNKIQKGMSGGPVLNARGEVLAINGVHQEPLWGDHLFADGSKPPTSLRQTFANSSWAIPVETFIPLFSH